MAEIYTFKNGVSITDEEQSALMYRIEELDPLRYSRDDIGTAEMLGDIYQDKIRYCPQNDSWYIWGGCWRKQSDSGVISDMLQTVLNLLNLWVMDQGDSVKEYAKYLHHLRMRSAMDNVLSVLKTQVRMLLYEMDTDPYIFNTPGRAYNLKTGDPVTDFTNVTKLCATHLPAFEGQPCRRWHEFIDEIMSHNKEKAAFLQRALGYSLLGVNREECMFIAYGSTTRNGKGTLFSTVNTVLGEDYADTAPVDLICERKGKAVDFNAPQPSLAKLVGTRLVTMSEAPRDVRLDAAAMKTLTGRDSLVTRGLFEKAFSFTPQFTMWLNTNFLPAVNDDTVFASDRIWVIEFNEHFDSGRQDKDLKEVFADPANRPTILKWLLDGVSDYMRQGLNPPACVIEATAAYRRMHDRLGSFVSERLTPDSESSAPRGMVYSMYRAWCGLPENRFTPLGSTSFYSEMAVKGYASVRRSDGWYIKGIKLEGGAEC